MLEGRGAQRGRVVFGIRTEGDPVSGTLSRLPIHPRNIIACVPTFSRMENRRAAASPAGKLDRGVSNHNRVGSILNGNTAIEALINHSFLDRRQSYISAASACARARLCGLRHRELGTRARFCRGYRADSFATCQTSSLN